MKSLLTALAVISLTACVSVPVERRFPAVPAELMTPCPPLVTIPADTTKISTVVDAVVVNYGQYQSCSLRVDSWIEWYTVQQKIFEAVK